MTLKAKKWDGERVRKLRERHGLTAQQLASLIGISQPAIARIESGKHQLNVMVHYAWDNIEAQLESERTAK